MSPPPTARPIEVLLAEAEWLRGLARRLARDASEADDLVQEAWSAALAHPPDPARPTRAWLGTVLTNAARALRRSSGRRERREQRAARPEALPSASELVLRAEAQRELVQAVLELPEPLRETMLLRHFEGLAPRAIARRLDVPGATVRSRLARGLALLRARFDRRHGGDRAAWIALLLPPPERAALSVPLLGGALVNAKIALALGVAAAGLALFLFVRSPGGASANAETALEPPATALASGSAPGAAPAPAAAASDTQRTSLASAPVPAAAAAAPARASARIRGRVLDAEAQPIADVAVGVEAADGSSAPLARTGPDGVFEAPWPAAPGALVAADERWCTILAAVPGDPDQPLVVVAAPRAALHGTVSDELGQPLADARVVLEMPAGFRTRFRDVLDRARPRTFQAASGADGRFDLSGVPRVPDARVHVARAGFTSLELELLEVPASPWPVVLRRPDANEHSVRGRVVDAAGVPVADARVALGIDTTKSADDGSFAFDLDDPGSMGRRFGVRPDVLRALKPGFLPAELRPIGGPDGPRWPEPIVLRLGGPSLSIAGEVRGTEGEPAAGLRVWLTDPTTFGAGARGALQIEDLLAGAEERGWRWVETDERGRFEVDGLAARDYVLAAMDPATLLRADSEPIAAGTQGVVLRLPADGLYPLVAGSVRGHDGTPLAGVRVGTMCDAFRARWEGSVISTHHAGAGATVTDEHGRFELRDVPRSLVYLRFDGAEILPLEYGRWVEGDPRLVDVEVKRLPTERIADLDVRVDRRAHVQVELAEPGRADEFGLLDARGRAIELSTFEAGGREEGPRAPIVAGRSDVVAGSDRARTLVLYRAGAEVERAPIALRPGETAMIRL